VEPSDRPDRCGADVSTTSSRSADAASAAAEARDLSRGLVGAGVAVCAWSTGTVLGKGIDVGGLAIGA